MGSYMVSKVMQDLASMGSACGAVSGAGAAAASALGRSSTRTTRLAQPSSPPWPRGPMACSVLYSLSVCVCGDSRSVAYVLRAVCHLECQSGMFTGLVSFCVAAL